jgi:hypothetical protein
VTKAGMLSAIDSQPPKIASIGCERPSAMPIALPSTMAKKKATATRARVTARLNKSSPVIKCR